MRALFLCLLVVAMVAGAEPKPIATGVAPGGATVTADEEAKRFQAEVAALVKKTGCTRTEAEMQLQRKYGVGRQATPADAAEAKAATDAKRTPAATKPGADPK